MVKCNLSSILIGDHREVFVCFLLLCFNGLNIPSLYNVAPSLSLAGILLCTLGDLAYLLNFIISKGCALPPCRISLSCFLAIIIGIICSFVSSFELSSQECGNNNNFCYATTFLNNLGLLFFNFYFAVLIINAARYDNNNNIVQAVAIVTLMIGKCIIIATGFVFISAFSSNDVSSDALLWDISAKWGVSMSLFTLIVVPLVYYLGRIRRISVFVNIWNNWSMFALSIWFLVCVAAYGFGVYSFWDNKRSIWNYIASVGDLLPISTSGLFLVSEFVIRWNRIELIGYKSISQGGMQPSMTNVEVKSKNSVEPLESQPLLV